jgi:hypothetical protein
MDVDEICCGDPHEKFPGELNFDACQSFIVLIVKSWRLQWAEQVARMEKQRMYAEFLWRL